MGYELCDEVWDEFQRACEKHPPMASHHEAYAIIREELDEYWDEVKKRPKKRDPVNLRLEPVQTAAMCIRALNDLYDRGTHDTNDDDDARSESLAGTQDQADEEAQGLRGTEHPEEGRQGGHGENKGRGRDPLSGC